MQCKSWKQFQSLLIAAVYSLWTAMRTLKIFLYSWFSLRPQKFKQGLFPQNFDICAELHFCVPWKFHFHILIDYEARAVEALEISLIGGFRMTSPKRRLCKLGRIFTKFLCGLKDDMTCLFTKFEIIWTSTIELWAKEVGEFSMVCYMGKWAGGHPFAYQHGCCNINVWRFS